MTRFQRASWLGVVLVTLVACAAVVPLAPTLGPTTIFLSDDTVLDLASASLTMPAGWDVDIAASSLRSPTATRQGVEVSATDAIWLGDSDSLLAKVNDLVFDGQGAVPGVPDGARGAEAERWRIVAGSSADSAAPARVDVVREGQSVVLLVVRGEASDVERLGAELDAIVASVEVFAPSFDVGADA